MVGMIIVDRTRIDSQRVALGQRARCLYVVVAATFARGDNERIWLIIIQGDQWHFVGS